MGIPDNLSGKFAPSSHWKEILSSIEDNSDDRGNSSGRASHESRSYPTVTSDYQILRFSSDSNPKRWPAACKQSLMRADGIFVLSDESE
jgi:hypothetical protein